VLIAGAGATVAYVVILTVRCFLLAHSHPSGFDERPNRVSCALRGGHSSHLDRWHG
jgi:hypothetical protein